MRVDDDELSVRNPDRIAGKDRRLLGGIVP